MIMKYKSLKILFYSLFGNIIAYKLVFAQAGSNSSNITGSNEGGSGYTTLKNPIDSNTFTQLIDRIIEFILFLAVPVLVIAIIWVGLLFVLAQGNEGKLKTAKSNLFWTLVGAAVIIGAKLIKEVLKGTIGAITG